MSWAKFLLGVQKGQGLVVVKKGELVVEEIVPLMPKGLDDHVEIIIICLVLLLHLIKLLTKISNEMTLLTQCPTYTHT